MVQDVREVLRNEPPRRASAAGGFPSAGDWRRQGRQAGDILRELVGDNLELVTVF